MFEPTNEQGAIAVFCSRLSESGWEIVSIGTPFPDALLRKNDEEWRVEFEFRARNFIQHAHDFRECDLIICWLNDFAECPIPVIELSDPLWVTVNPRKGNPMMAQVEYWRNRALIAESKLLKVERQAKPVVKKAIIPKSEDANTEADIVRFLKDNPGTKLDDIAAQFDTTKSNVSKKVTALVKLGVLHEERQGNRRVVTVNGNHETYLNS